MQVILSQSVSAICNQINAAYNVCVTEWEASTNNVCCVYMLY